MKDWSLTTLLDNLEDRGPWGSSNYRGNCSGWIPYKLSEFFKPKLAVDFMVGGGTSKDVYDYMGIENFVTDLNPQWGGFDLVNDEIPHSFDFAMFHPPYNRKDKGIILYSGNMWGSKDPRDLSQMPWDKYLKALNKCIAKQYIALRKGGRLAMLIGDCREKGKLYSAMMDCIKPGELEHVIIKKQENCDSYRKNYNNAKFIPIVTEYLLVFKKIHHYIVGMKQTVYLEKDLRESKVTTWRDVVYSSLEHLGGRANLQELYKEIKNHYKTKRNKNWEAKVRQVLQTSQDFMRVDKGTWAVNHPPLSV